MAHPDTDLRSRLESLLREVAEVRLAASADQVLATVEQSNIELLLCPSSLPGPLRLHELFYAARKAQPDLVFLLLADTIPAALEREDAVLNVPPGSLTDETGRARLLVVADRAVTKQRRERERAFHRSRDERAAMAGRNLFIGRSRAASFVRQEVKRAAQGRLNVLLTGETGVGKTLIAESIHFAAPGASKRPFVVVEPAALPPSLFESELFGYARGAFTGADKAQIGAFEAADGGTLFLDEIGELSTGLQVKLLRAVEQKSVRRLGESRERQLDVRLIAATNRDLLQDVEDDRFREDLYQRLNEIALCIPPLRERREDVPLLFEHFLGEMSVTRGAACELTPEAATALEAHDWPGNVRELRNLVRRLIASGPPSRIDSHSLSTLLPARLEPRQEQSAMAPEERIRAYSRRVWADELRKHGFSIRRTARALEMPYPTLRSRLKALNLLEWVAQKRGA